MSQATSKFTPSLASLLSSLTSVKAQTALLEGDDLSNEREFQEHLESEQTFLATHNPSQALPPLSKPPLAAKPGWVYAGSLFHAMAQVAPVLAAGVYRIVQGSALFPVECKTDCFIVIPKSVSFNLLAEFQRFWDLRDRFKE